MKKKAFVYRNRTTYSIVYPLKTTRHLVRVKYANSNQTAWFRKGDFIRLFEKVDAVVSAQKLYQNKRTNKKLFIVKEGPVGIQVQYVVSGHQFWYNRSDFNRMFEKVKK